MPSMVGIVLGAGASRRLGRPKQTLPVGDTTLLGYVLREAEASALDRVVLVVGGAADESLAGVEPSRATVVRNDSYGTGCASSLLPASTPPARPRRSCCSSATCRAWVP
jgi:molybdenum cofactor cytidylyltransferase